MKHELESLELRDGILAPILQVRCSCGWSHNRFIDKVKKADKKDMMARFTEHASSGNSTSQQCAKSTHPVK